MTDGGRRVVAERIYGQFEFEALLLVYPYSAVEACGDHWSWWRCLFLRPLVDALFTRKAQIYFFSSSWQWFPSYYLGVHCVVGDDGHHDTFVQNLPSPVIDLFNH